MNYQAAHETASAAAQKAAETLNSLMGPEEARGLDCGFAWVEAPKVKMNTREGKALKALGFKKIWSPAKGAYLWSPAKVMTQSIGVLYAGAQAYAETFQAATGIEMHANKRYD
jgi:hypothetical protein